MIRYHPLLSSGQLKYHGNLQAAQSIIGAIFSELLALNSSKPLVYNEDIRGYFDPPFRAKICEMMVNRSVKNHLTLLYSSAARAGFFTCGWLSLERAFPGTYPYP